MTREIKFRAWDKKAKGFTVALGSGAAELLFKRNLETTTLELVATNPDLILMQYIGLKDKSGTEIYEGDIVKLKNSKEWSKKEFDHMQGIKEVLYNEEQLRFCGKDYTSLDWGGTESIEVIGNIYENPELLKGGDSHE